MDPLGLYRPRLSFISNDMFDTFQAAMTASNPVFLVDSAKTLSRMDKNNSRALFALHQAAFLTGDNDGAADYLNMLRNQTKKKELLDDLYYMIYDDMILANETLKELVAYSLALPEEQTNQTPQEFSQIDSYSLTPPQRTSSLFDPSQPSLYTKYQASIESDKKRRTSGQRVFVSRDPPYYSANVDHSASLRNLKEPKVSELSYQPLQQIPAPYNTKNEEGRWRDYSNSIPVPIKNSNVPFKEKKPLTTTSTRQLWILAEAAVDAAISSGSIYQMSMDERKTVIKTLVYLSSEAESVDDLRQWGALLEAALQPGSEAEMDHSLGVNALPTDRNDELKDKWRERLGKDLDEQDEDNDALFETVQTPEEKLELKERNEFLVNIRKSDSKKNYHILERRMVDVIIDFFNAHVMILNRLCEENDLRSPERPIPPLVSVLNLRFLSDIHYVLTSANSLFYQFNPINGTFELRTSSSKYRTHFYSHYDSQHRLFLHPTEDEVQKRTQELLDTTIEVLEKSTPEDSVKIAAWFAVEFDKIQPFNSHNMDVLLVLLSSFSLHFHLPIPSFLDSNLRLFSNSSTHLAGIDLRTAIEIGQNKQTLQPVMNLLNTAMQRSALFVASFDSDGPDCGVASLKEQADNLRETIGTVLTDFVKTRNSDPKISENLHISFTLGRENAKRTNLTITTDQDWIEMKMMEESEREAREMYESVDPATVEHWDIAEEEKKETPFGPPSFARSVGEDLFGAEGDFSDEVVTINMLHETLFNCEHAMDWVNPSNLSNFGPLIDSFSLHFHVQPLNSEQPTILVRVIAQPQMDNALNFEAFPCFVVEGHFDASGLANEGEMKKQKEKLTKWMNKTLVDVFG
ncbi:hypothetical protein BLNAU_10921 [Blattamonas nauphoetae]|uniref:Uncharacterized protein n=1 Tax=Blattamonas nauphoetae TaxID=2049346 RepID=A0ABQ9XR49_9EUKA|nr:hypothetical protein BLNAU_10921 [Blattamonas nauphoetae]